MMLDRVNSCYQRDKNHPAILIWSVGNEAFGGKVVFDMSEKFRELDPHRLVHYEGIFNDRRYEKTSDMESQMYPPVAKIEQFLAEHKEKPFICCEYTHAMGNSCGAMHKYTDLTDREPRYQGGFIWDYIDQSILKKDRYGKEFQAYGGDFLERSIIRISASTSRRTVPLRLSIRTCLSIPIIMRESSCYRRMESWSENRRCSLQ